MELGLEDSRKMELAKKLVPWAFMDGAKGVCIFSKITCKILNIAMYIFMQERYGAGLANIFCKVPIVNILHFVVQIVSVANDSTLPI